ncbi:MAG: biopolymer transport protein ExbD [Halocynthiibacter sp.]|jgi:biopolymer transport protein ExbD
MSVAPKAQPSRVQLDVSLPIVNIVLLLIFFFLATGQLLNPPSSGVELTETSELPLDQLPEPILVVNADGSWALNGVPVARELIGPATDGFTAPYTLHVLINKSAPASALLEIAGLPELAEAEIRLVTIHDRPAP